MVIDMERNTDIKYYLKFGDMYYSDTTGGKVCFTPFKSDACAFRRDDVFDVDMINFDQKRLKDKGFETRLVKSITTITTTEEDVE